MMGAVTKWSLPTSSRTVRPRRRAEAASIAQKRKFVKLTSLVATVDGVSVAPDDAEPRVKDARLHRPSEPTTGEAQAAGVSTPASSSSGGMLNFLIAALLLASLAAWLIRQIGPLRD